VSLARILIYTGLALVALGILVAAGGKLPFRLGGLPGDIAIHTRNGSFYFPVVTCIVISVLLTVVLRLFR